jgi:Hemocyanin, copper containing domain
MMLQVTFSPKSKLNVIFHVFFFLSQKENMGVMGDSVTAMRDPIFYRWHKFIDSLFQQFKATLSPYTTQQVRS